MTADRAFAELDLTLDLDPPRLDARRPLAVAFAGAAGRFTALAGLELERFAIADPGAPAPRPDRAWARAIDALVRLPDGAELWHVVATRRPAGPDGALLRAGWLAVGRAATAHDAALAAERTLDAALELLGSALDYATIAAVTAADPLLDLVRPLRAPFVRALRRARWNPPLAVWRAEGRTDGLPGGGLLLPWAPPRARDEADPAPWGPLAEALAAEPDHAAFVVRAAACARPPAEVEEDAARDLVAIGAAYDRLSGARTQVYPSERLTALAAARVRAARERSLLVQAQLATWRAGTDGLAATAIAAIVSADAGGADDAARPPATPVDLVDLDPDAAWAPLDARAEPHLCVPPRDAWPLVRTCEPPTDERSPLPCGRGRIHAARALPAEGLVIGDALHRGHRAPVRIPLEDRLRHVYCVGQTGTGKSTLLLNLIAQDLAAGHGVTVLDPHGSLVAAVLDQVPKARATDVVLIDAANLDRFVPLNPLHTTIADPAAYAAFRDRTIDELLDTFDQLYDLRATGGPLFEQCFRVFTTLLMGAGPPDGHRPVLPMIELVMGQPALRAALAKRLTAAEPLASAALKNLEAARGDGELRNLVPYVVSKLNRFYQSAAARRILCQPECLDFDAVLRDRKIVLISMTAAHVGKEAAALIARQVILRLWLAAMARGTAPDAPAHVIYADEFHAFASERFTALLAEARKFRLGLVLAHQYTSQLVHRRDGRAVLDAVLGNVGTIVAFRVGPADAELLEGAFAPRATPLDVVGLANHTALVRSSGALANVPFTVFTRPPPPVSPGRVELTRAVRALAGLAYGRDREIVDLDLQRALRELRAIGGGD